ncbi:MAG: RsiV family protein [Rikenella sp.]|nr:RsiV family protein [Rikenella sp.]
MDDFPYGNHFITENFILLPKGILFVYKPYEIASYAMGTIGVPLSYEKIKHLLTPSAHAYFDK